MTRKRLLLLLPVLVLLAVFLAGNNDLRLVAEKGATALVMPFGLCWLISLFCCLIAWKRGERSLFRLAALLSVILYLAGNGVLAKWLLRSLEYEYLTCLPLDSGNYDTVILLGGGTGTRPGNLAELGFAGDRVFLAAELFHAGKTRHILCTGTKIERLDRGGSNPGEAAIVLLGRVGVPTDCLTYVEGRTTSEEMRQLASVLPDKPRVGLITSAWHMRRAVRLARAEGLTVLPLPADFRSPVDMTPTLLDWIPDSYSAESNRIACKEWLAYCVGR